MKRGPENSHYDTKGDGAWALTSNRNEDTRRTVRYSTDSEHPVYEGLVRPRDAHVRVAALELALHDAECGNESVLLNVQVGLRRDCLEWVVGFNLQAMRAKRRPEQATELLAEVPTARFVLRVWLGHVLAEGERDPKCAYVHVGCLRHRAGLGCVVYTLQESCKCRMQDGDRETHVVCRTEIEDRRVLFLPDTPN